MYTTPFTSEAASPVPDLGLAMWLIFGAIVAIGIVALTRWRRGASGAAVVGRITQWFSLSPLGSLLGFIGPADCRRWVAEMTEASRLCLLDDFALALENSIQPAGCLVLVLPADTAVWVDEHKDLTLRIVENTIQATLGEAYVEANAKSHPKAGQSHRATVRDAARTGAPRAAVSVRFLPTYAANCGAVFSGSVESATRMARRKFGSSIPVGVRALEVPTIAPAMEAEAGATPFENISDIEDFLAAPAPTSSFIPEAKSYHGSAPRPTEAFSSVATEPFTPISATLTSGVAEVSCCLRLGQDVTVGRGFANDVVVPDDDLSVSAEHLRMALGRGCVEIEASGRTGTWVTTPSGQRLLRAGSIESVPLPATITLGDARKTVLSVVETGREA